jgi:hypothetical protein
MAAATGRIVALCGTRWSGKDTVASMLVQQQAKGAVLLLKLAAPMKGALRSLFDLSEDDVDGTGRDVPHPLWGVTPRSLMQWFGTDVMQHGLRTVVPTVGRTFWAEKLAREIEALQRQQPGAHFVVSDVRFQHEVDLLRSRFGRDRVVAVRVHRVPDQGLVRCPWKAHEDAHESEAGVGCVTVDLLLRNDGSLEDLRARVDELLSPLLSPLQNPTTT